jgi:aspartyl-tRNA(Asn)/glutamyl-tRNA(Gln) amidotransferase subunit B
VGQTEFGTRAELKNMNSFRFVKAALEYEIKRQRALLAAGREIVQETRLWDTAANQTVSMRGKEEAHDYRYFPDPDLVPVKVDGPWIASLTRALPELPAARLDRFQTEYGLPEYDAEVLTSDKARADNFEATIREFPLLSPKPVSNWFLDDPAAMATVTPGTSGTLLTLVGKGTISRNQAKEVLKEVVATGKDPETIIKEKGLAQISDAGALETAAQEIINAYPKEAADYRGGKTKVMGFFVGQLMKKTRGQANPQLANEIFQRLLAS